MPLVHFSIRPIPVNAFENVEVRDKNRQQLVNAGAIPVLVSLLNSADAGVQYYCTMALSNIAVDRANRKKVASSEPKLVTSLMMLMDSPSLKVQCQAAFALRNLAGDGSSCLPLRVDSSHSSQKYMLETVRADGLSSLLRLLQSATNHRSWNLASYNLSLSFKDNEEVQCHAISTLCNPAASSKKNKTAIVKAGAVESIKELVLEVPMNEQSEMTSNPTTRSTSVPKSAIETSLPASIMKGTAGIVIALCSRNKAEELDNTLEADVEEYATCGVRALAVAYEELDGDDHEAERNGFELIGLIAIFNPPRDRLAIAKETGRRLGLGDHTYPDEVLKDGPAPSGKHASLNAMTPDADGFAGVFPEHKYGIHKRATDAARGAADIVLSEPGLSTIVRAVCGSRIIFQLLIIALLNNGAVMTLSVDCVLPSNTPTVTCRRRHYHGDKFGATLLTSPVDANDDQLRAIIYMQVTIISQALIFVTRSHGFFFMERPSYTLMGAFCVAQLISSIIAAYGRRGFTDLHGIPGGWIGLVGTSSAAAATRATSQSEGVSMTRTTSCAASSTNRSTSTMFCSSNVRRAPGYDSQTSMGCAGSSAVITKPPPDAPADEFSRILHISSPSSPSRSMPTRPRRNPGSKLYNPDRDPIPTMRRTAEPQAVSDANS
ncbi:hypothetical protein FB446DRAFT_815236 [Lentinula raphanica]|nr:hypothetical protein FB446DRAFT_815236 [Lentinula raphanica]